MDAGSAWGNPLVMVQVFVEGGGERKDQKSRCREGFRKLTENAGLSGHMPTFVACGSRNDAYGSFCTAVRVARPDEYPFLLVDSEDPVSDIGEPDSPIPWRHLRMRDRWQKPASARSDQALLMVTCMETWLIADWATLRSVFGPQLQESALLPVQDLETRARHEVLQSLESATKACGPARMYSKGPRSFEVLARVSPDLLATHLPNFRRFVSALRRQLG